MSKVESVKKVEGVKKVKGAKKVRVKVECPNSILILQNGSERASADLLTMSREFCASILEYLVSSCVPRRVVCNGNDV